MVNSSCERLEEEQLAVYISMKSRGKRMETAVQLIDNIDTSDPGLSKSTKAGRRSIILSVPSDSWDRSNLHSAISCLVIRYHLLSRRESPSCDDNAPVQPDVYLATPSP